MGVNPLKSERGTTSLSSPLAPPLQILEHPDCESVDLSASALGTDILAHVIGDEDVFALLFRLLLISDESEMPCSIEWKCRSFSKQFPQDVVEFLSIYVIQLSLL